ncbi:MAG: copper resistance protein NlpE N-terminal domain-containing protein [Acinetobacter sp.]
MKKAIFIPLAAAAAALGCQDADQGAPQAAQLQGKAAVQKQAVPAWAGKYQGTTPCMGCISRCEECPGMAVDLALHQDMSYELRRESLSGHNDVQVLKGRMLFKDQAQTQLQLLNVKTRNLIYVDLAHQLLEIREDQTAKPYAAQDDFLLEPA